MTDSSLSETLRRHSIELDLDTIERLDRYCELLWEWNTKLNLTRHRDYEAFVTRDLLDTQQLANQLRPGERVLDVGSGGGVPGMLLAIVRPDLEMTLSESMGKKARALSEIGQELGLPARVIGTRAEQVLAESRFETVIARAVGPMWKLLSWLAPHWDAFDRLLLIKGPRWVEERLEARHRGHLRPLELRRVAVYSTPGHDGENVILCMTRKSAAAASE